MNSIFDFSSITANIIGGITVFLITVTIPAILIWLWRRFVVIKKLHEQELINVLSSIGANRLNIIKSKFFIKTMGQFNVPIEGCVENSNRFPLVNYFINQIFVKNDLSKKRFVVLGGSGMGKSTFITSLIFSYFQKYRYKTIPYNIYLVNLGNEDATSRIKELSKNIDANKSILILEAMDESTEAQNNNEEYLKFINKTSINFKYVIITCRTNIFVDELSFPKYTGFYDGQNLLKFDILHISPFSETEILQYLDNKFGIGTKKYQKAMIIKNKCNGLLSRAMILNFIDDVLSIALDNKITSFKIYYTIIEKWLCRELRIEKIGDSLDEIRKLYRFSTDIAMYMYRSGKQYIVKDEYRMFCEKHGYISDPYSYNTRSLITRRNDGAIMFAHKSFFDFFIAVIAFERPEVQFDSNSFESKEFVKEINKYYLCEEKLPLINYYQLPFECEDFTSEAIDKILNNCECIFDVSYECNEDVNVKMHELICTLWMQLAKRLKRHFENISIENRNGEYLNGLQEWLVVTHIIYKVQKIFLSIEDINKVKNELIEIRDDISELKNMKMGYQKDKMATYQINTYQNEIIVYPCVIDNEMFAKINKYTCIILGGAFSNDKEVLSTLKDLLESESVKNIYILLKKNNNEYIINRIGQIVVLIKSIGSKFNKETIVQLLSDRFCYIVSIDTLIRSKDEICKCVNNMLKQ